MQIIHNEKETTTTSQSLPPTKYLLYLHINCANYQFQYWRKALDHHPQFPYSVEHRWIDFDRFLAVQLGLLKPAPDSILEFVSCSCKKSKYSTNNCGCEAVNLLCTNLFGCTNYKNNDSQERVDVNEIFNDDAERIW